MRDKPVIDGGNSALYNQKKRGERTMMITPEIIAQMKQRKNVSADKDKTKARFGDLWKAAKNVTKNQILELAATGRPSAHNAYKTGIINARLALSAAQAFGVDPSYITGSADDKGIYDEGTVSVFLKNKGFAYLIREIKAQGKTVQAGEPAAVEPGADAAESGGSDKKAVNNITHGEAVTLLEAMVIRARFDAESQAKLLKIMAILLS